MPDKTVMGGFTPFQEIGTPQQHREVARVELRYLPGVLPCLVYQ